ncbi:MAG: septum formation initiator family protein [Patescibacteria group bacterium]|jgi:cell division protein FtsL
MSLENSEIKQKIFFRFLSIVGIVIILLLAVSLVREAINRNKIALRISDLQNQTDDLKRQNNDLQYRIDNWNSTGELESSARTQLGLKRAGEKAFVIMRPETLGSSTSSIEEVVIRDNQDLLELVDSPSSAKESNPAKWWRYFFN